MWIAKTIRKAYEHDMKQTGREREGWIGAAGHRVQWLDPITAVSLINVLAREISGISE
jgi:hypothetical protein